VQILFGVDSAADPVCPLVRELLAEFPGTDARLVLCERRLGVNNKVSTLRQLEPFLRQPLVIISDADVSVPPDFLANVAPLLAEPGTGLVNCFYRLANPSTVASRWETVAINSDFWSSVLQAHSLEKVDFALGAVMSLPWTQLQAIGGFATLADVLADDYELGHQVARLGGRIVFSTIVVDCHEPARDWSQTWAHQQRWARTIRSCQPALFFFSILENATVWPVLWILACAWRWLANLPAPIGFSQAVVLFLAAICFRVVTALKQEQWLTQTKAHFRWFWMVPVKDVLNLAIWMAAFTGNKVQWRGQTYRIRAGGKLQKVG
jgi:ceramide glucosyltransferase